MSAWVSLLAWPLCVAGLALFLLLADAFVGLRGRALGGAAAAGLTAILVATFFYEPSGTLPHGVVSWSAWETYFSRVFLSAALLATLGAIDWLDRRTPGRQAEYYVLVLLSTVGMMLVPAARDFIVLLVAFELMGIPLYVLAAWEKSDKHDGPGAKSEARLGAEASLKLFVTGAASSTLTLFGLAIITGLTGTTSFAGLASAPQPLTSVALVLVVAGLAFKVGAVPFHMWVPDTYQGAPLPFVAFLSVAPKAGGLAALYVVLQGAWPSMHGTWGQAVAVLAVASMVLGNLLAAPQSDVRRLLGYSGIAQVGYVLVALAAGTTFATSTALFFIATYVFTNMGAFLVVEAASRTDRYYTLPELAGLSKRSPWLGASLLVFLLSLAGIPFVAGFWAKLYLFLAAWQAGQVLLVVVALVFAVVGLFYYLGVARSTFMAEGTPAAPLVTPIPLALAICLCLALVVGLGLSPGRLTDAADSAARALLTQR